MPRNDDKRSYEPQFEGRGSGRIDAVTMLRAARTDPEMAVPTYPAFIPGSVAVPIADGLIVDGGASRQLLNGSAATTLVPKLVNLLDGSRTVQEIADELAIPSVQVEAAVALLSSCGLIVPSLDAPDNVAPDIAAAVTRHLDTTKRWPSAAEAYNAAAEQPAYIVNSGLLAQLVTKYLLASGDKAQLVDSPSEAENTGYIVLVGADYNVMKQAERHTADTKGVVKICGLQQDRIWVAPTSSKQAPCIDCLLSALEEENLVDSVDENNPVLPLAASLIALEIFHERLGIGRPLSSNSLLIHSLAKGRSSQSMVPRTPGCNGCGVRGSYSGFSWPFVYDQAAVFPPRNQVAMKGHQVHYKPSNVALQWDRREFAHCERHRFSTDLDWQNPTDARSKLGAWLRYGFGLRQINDITEVRRFSPTGGNLGSPEAAIIVRDIEGIKAGTYYYLPFEDKCAYLGEFPTEYLSSALPEIDFDAILIMTTALDRVEKKYHTLALRICLLDAGVALSQLRHAADALDFDVVQVQHWDDQMLTKQLGNNRFHPVMAVIGLRGINESRKEQ